MRSSVGIESLVWLTDIAGLTHKEAAERMLWSARALLLQALADADRSPNYSRTVPAHRVPVLTNPDVTPDEVQIRAALGDAFSAWQGLESALTEPPFGLILSWHHFRDGGWLRKALRGKRNVAWLAVWEDYATVTFYFAARHRKDLVALPIPEALRMQAAEAEMTGRMLPLVIEIRSRADLDAALEVLRFKLGAR